MPYSTDQAEDGLEVPICPFCFEPLPDVPGWQAPFCPNCAGPVTGIATTDPLGQAFALGHVARNVIGSVNNSTSRARQKASGLAPSSGSAGEGRGGGASALDVDLDQTAAETSSESKRNRIAKVGVCLIALSVISPLFFESSFFNEASLTDTLNTIIAAGLVLLFAVILWKATTR